MSDNYADYHKWLNEQQLFHTLATDVAQRKPKLPTFNPSEDNTDDWKVKTGMQQGFDLAFSLLTGHSPNDYSGD